MDLTSTREGEGGGGGGRQQQWNVSSHDATESRSPSMSPAHRKQIVKRTHNVATKAAAQHLAKVMALQNEEYDDDEEEEHGFKFAPPSSAAASLPAVSFARRNRSQSPAIGRNNTEKVTTTRSSSAGRSYRSAAAPNASPMWMPPQHKASLKPPTPNHPLDPPYRDRDNRYFGDASVVDSREKGYQMEASALRDELDMLLEENENVLEELLRAQEKREEAEARVKELEKQVASLGEGVSLEAKLLSRKEASLRQREAALKAANEKKDGKKDEVFSLRSELQILKDEAVAAEERFQEVESEAKELRTMTQRMILTHDEMEEVALKRCWLARYWGLAVEHGICADIAPSRHEKWSALAPLPFELVISAAQKAKELSQNEGEADEDQTKTARFLSDLTGEGNIESMLSVEMGLRELASLKVEEAVMLAFAQKRTPSLVRQDSKGHGELRFVESYELKEGEKEDVSFKQAWLTYFWGRAKLHNVEEDIADEHLQFWINRSEEENSPNSNDVVDVERGLLELKKLGVEEQLWEACRQETDTSSSSSSSSPSSSSSSSSSPTSTLLNHKLDS